MFITPLSVFRLSLLDRMNFQVARSIFRPKFGLNLVRKGTIIEPPTTNGIATLRILQRTRTKRTNSRVFQILSLTGLLPLFYYIQNDGSEFGINLRPIYNETAAYKADVGAISDDVTDTLTRKKEKRKAMYRQLTFGSILGIVCGLLMIKVSVVLIYLTVFGMLGLQWLQSRNLITVNQAEFFGLSKSLVTKYFKQGTESLTTADQYIYFKGSFLTSLVLTYLNS